MQIIDNFPNTGVSFMEMLPNNQAFVFDTKYGDIRLWNCKNKFMEKNLGVVYERRSKNQQGVLSPTGETIFTSDNKGL